MADEAKTMTGLQGTFGTDKGQRTSQVPQVEYDPPEITDEAMNDQYNEYYEAKYGAAVTAQGEAFQTALKKNEQTPA